MIRKGSRLDRGSACTGADRVPYTPIRSRRLRHHWCATHLATMTRLTQPPDIAVQSRVIRGALAALFDRMRESRRESIAMHAQSRRYPTGLVLVMRGTPNMRVTIVLNPANLRDSRCRSGFVTPRMPILHRDFCSGPALSVESPGLPTLSPPEPKHRKFKPQFSRARIESYEALRW